MAIYQNFKVYLYSTLPPSIVLLLPNRRSRSVVAEFTAAEARRECVREEVFVRAGDDAIRRAILVRVNPELGFGTDRPLGIR